MKNLIFKRVNVALTGYFAERISLRNMDDYLIWITISMFNFILNRRKLNGFGRKFNVILSIF